MLAGVTFLAAMFIAYAVLPLWASVILTVVVVVGMLVDN